MYCKYVYNPGATIASILNDVVALLTGETVVGNLSASCDKVNTELLTTIPAGWSVHDAAASSTSIVIKAPHVDAGFGNKYVQVDIPNATDFFLYGYSEWDSIAHTGMDKTANNTVSDQKISSAGGILYIASSARFIYVGAMLGAVFGDTNKSALLVAEFTPIQPWHTAASGIPAFVLTTGYTFVGSSYYAHFTKIKDKLGALNTGVDAQAYFLSIGTGYNAFTSATHFPAGSDSKVINSSGGFDVPRFPLFIGNAAKYSAPIGDVSAACDLYIAPANLLAIGETVDAGGVEYIALTAYDASGGDLTFLVRKG